MGDVNSLLSRLKKALLRNDIPAFCELLKSMLANIPYNLHISQERYYHSIFQLLGSLLSFDTQSEILTDKGRIDIVMTTPDHIYIFELKLNSTPEAALKHIEDNKYYLSKDKAIILVGLSFNRENKKLGLTCSFKTCNNLNT